VVVVVVVVVAAAESAEQQETGFCGMKKNSLASTAGASLVVVVFSPGN